MSHHLSETDRATEVVEKLLKEGTSLCDHVYVVGNKLPNGAYAVCCTVCMSMGPVGNTYDLATENFWKKASADRSRYIEILVSKIRNQEKIMANTDYDRGYKQGVTEALDLPLTFTGTYTSPYLQARIEDQRKKLLTKKVTKWTGIIKSNYSGEPTILELCNNKEEVEHYFTISDPLSEPIPIDIEVEL